MKKEHPRWGPSLSHYVDTFEDRIHQAYDDYVNEREIISTVHDGLAPLPLFESTLAVSENMHKEGFQLGECSIPVILKTIRRYDELHEQGIFSYYYGFLCIRHLTRMVCIATLLENSLLEDFLDGLDPREDTLEVTHILATRALQTVHDALATIDTMQIIGVIGCLNSFSLEAFPSLGGLGIQDAHLLVQLLWKGRRAIITIGSRGLLPGFGVLLYALSQIVTTIGKEQAAKFENWSELQELMIRYYFVASDPERALLRQLTRFIDQTMAQKGVPMGYPRYQEDAREVVQTYHDMVHSPLGLNLAYVMLLDTAYILFQFIMSVCASAGAEDVTPLAVSAGLERIWLECDKERNGFMLANRRGFTRQYMAWLFPRLLTLRQNLNTLSTCTAFARMLLADSNIMGIAGRVLMLAAMDDQRPDMWEDMLSALVELKELLGVVLAAGASEFAHHIVVEWEKVLKQLRLLRYGFAPTKLPARYLDEAIAAWQPLGPDTQETEICANPRCPFIEIESRPKEAQFVCSKCCLVKYCSLRCQTVHWCLKTADAHGDNCVPVERADLKYLADKKMESRNFFFLFDAPVWAFKQRSDFDQYRKFLRR